VWLFWAETRRVSHQRELSDRGKKMADAYLEGDSFMNCLREFSVFFLLHNVCSWDTVNVVRLQSMLWRWVQCVLQWQWYCSDMWWWVSRMSWSWWLAEHQSTSANWGSAEVSLSCVAIANIVYMCYRIKLFFTISVFSMVSDVGNAQTYTHSCNYIFVCDHGCASCLLIYFLQFF